MSISIEDSKMLKFKTPNKGRKLLAQSRIKEFQASIARHQALLANKAQPPK